MIAKETVLLKRKGTEGRKDSLEQLDYDQLEMRSTLLP